MRRIAMLVVLSVVLGPLPGAAGPAAPPSDPVVPVGGFGWPLAGIDPSGPPRPGAPGAVVRRFLPPPTPYGRGHRGADLAAPPGAVVLAAGPGTVAFAGVLAGRGVVSVRHAEGLRTTYEPVVVAVAAGAVVTRGTPLGTLAAGHRGCPAAACLHWGLRRALAGSEGGTGPPAGAAGPAGAASVGATPEEYLDPLLLVGLGRVRLLPLDDG